VSNARRILDGLDARLDQEVELTLYGRAALHLGFKNPPEEFAWSKDVDAVLWLGQAEELAERTRFWDAVTELNEELSEEGLYISHFFGEEQVILLPEWREQRVSIAGPWEHLRLYRLGDLDLLLSKLMRDDPIDRSDALFIVQRAGLSRDKLASILDRARIPDIPELHEQFEICRTRLLEAIDV
jgi:hypothetical protein